MRAGTAVYCAAEGALRNLTQAPALEANVPLRRAATPAKVADLGLYLASNKAACITGATIIIDGALSLLLSQDAWIRHERA